MSLLASQQVWILAPPPPNVDSTFSLLWLFYLSVELVHRIIALPRLRSIGDSKIPNRQQSQWGIGPRIGPPLMKAPAMLSVERSSKDS